MEHLLACIKFQWQSTAYPKSIQASNPLLPNSSKASPRKKLHLKEKFAELLVEQLEYIHSKQEQTLNQMVQKMYITSEWKGKIGQWNVTSHCHMLPLPDLHASATKDASFRCTLSNTIIGTDKLLPHIIITMKSTSSKNKEQLLPCIIMKSTSSKIKDWLLSLFRTCRKPEESHQQWPTFRLSN